MKKMIIIVAALMAAVFTACADNDKAVSYEELPAKAKVFISENFADRKLAYAKQERDFMEVHYEVVCVDGVKIEFDSKGAWTDIECRYTQLDEKFVPAMIRQKVRELYNDVTFRKISLERNGYEVGLSNGIDLDFDKNFALVKIDD